jgi:hypothetical protein
VIEWLRRKQQKVALLTNGRQWRLIHAGADYDAWCEWDTDAWFVAGETGPQVEALRLLLGRGALAVPAPGGTPPLVAAIQATRRGQAELSSALGERVRQAVEILLRESHTAIDAVRAEQEHPVTNRDVYIAAARIVMRLVVILFAESRNLLPRDNSLYWNSYSLDALRDLLPLDKDHLYRQHSAWPRLLALCRLLYHGSSHEKLPILRYGGGLFTPGKADDADPVLRALAALENPRHALSDAAVARMLDLITRAPIKVRQGRGTETVMDAVDFSQLDTEYIGILYEGLLDYELRRVEEALPVLFLNLGDQPALPLSRLEEMDDKALAGLVEKLKAKAKSPLPGEETGKEEEDEEEGDEPDEETEDDEEEEEPVEAIEAPDALTSPLFDDNDDVRRWRERATAWARRAAEAGKLVTKPRGRLTPEKQRQYEADLDKAAKEIANPDRLVLPGQYYLVRFGGTRKGSGTFYTKPALARPTVRRTLEPLAYADATPRTPSEILELKVCDPACGSGSFLVGALRYLTGALYEALFTHHWLAERSDGSIGWANPPDPVPAWFAEALKDFSGINEPAPRGADGETQSAENKIRARLGRVVVERCLYGVDLDSLAVELARLALWVETMDPFLPFSFLDHKVKCGNALVGCWFDRFQDYPAKAWEREGGDTGFKNFVHHYWDKTLSRGPNKGQIERAGDVWTAAIKNKKAIMTGQIGGQIDLFFPVADAEKTFADALHLYEEMHTAGLRDQETQAVTYTRYQESVAVLRRAFDAWCALWFWPAEELDLAPLPSNFGHPNAETAREIARLAAAYRFFHWELEFPDVFNPARQGFSAVIGNPPWEIQKPNSKEWFSNTDPLYRTYGKQEALAKQKALFAAFDGIERDWLLYKARLKGLGNWCKNAGAPFDERRQALRRGRSFADPQHPFLHQGSADVNTYKLFLELGHALLKGAVDRLISPNEPEARIPLGQGGRLGFIVPSGIYTDRGSTALRTLFLDQCRWDWLFCFENSDKIFDIHRSFKFCPVLVEKGGRTQSIRAAFMVRDLEAWEEGERHVLDYPADRIAQFSPKSRAILEIRSEKDLAILEKMYANGVLLGDDGPDGWGIQYAREFDMTNDSKLFPPRPKWEAEGYRPDQYGHWLKGNWRDLEANPNGLEKEETAPQERWHGLPAREAEGRDAVAEQDHGQEHGENHGQDAHATSGVVLSRDGHQQIALEEIEDVALPLYEGRMIGQFDFSQKGWVSGKGRTAVWREIGFEEKVIEPQYLMNLGTFNDFIGKNADRRICFMDITSSTNMRTMIASYAPPFPFGNSAPVFSTKSEPPSLASVLCSYAYDYTARGRCGGLHLNYFVVEETPLINVLPISALSTSVSLNMTSIIFAPAWLSLLDSLDASSRDTLLRTPWYRLWAVTPHERLRLRCILDAVVAHFYGLDAEDFRWILRDCDHPADQVTNKAFARTLDPKGFWRVDKTQPPELRHTVLAQVAFADLQTLIAAHGETEALRRFLGSGPDDGWMLPETLRLSDYHLGHDARAQKPQPVATALGPSFYPWQLTQSAEESWAECRQHAENIRRIREVGRKEIQSSKPVTQSGKDQNRKIEISSIPTNDLFAEFFNENITASITPRAPQNRHEAFRALLLHLIHTQPGRREDEYCDVLELAKQANQLAGALKEESVELLRDLIPNVPPIIFTSGGKERIRWRDLWKFLVDHRYVTIQMDNAVRRFQLAGVPKPEHGYLVWPEKNFGRLIFEAYETNPSDLMLHKYEVRNLETVEV